MSPRSSLLAFTACPSHPVQMRSVDIGMPQSQPGELWLRVHDDRVLVVVRMKPCLTVRAQAEPGLLLHSSNPVLVSCRQLALALRGRRRLVANRKHAAVPAAEKGAVPRLMRKHHNIPEG